MRWVPFWKKEFWIIAGEWIKPLLPVVKEAAKIYLENLARSRAARK